MINERSRYNILRTAFRAIATQSFDYYAFAERTTQANGQ